MEFTKNEYDQMHMLLSQRPEIQMLWTVVLFSSVPCMCGGGEGNSMKYAYEQRHVVRIRLFFSLLIAFDGLRVCFYSVNSTQTHTHAYTNEKALIALNNNDAPAKNVR